MTEKIQQFLAKFSDQRLASLQCAAEDGTLVYNNCQTCLVHYFEGDYAVTKWLGPNKELAKEAETEYRLLGRSDDAVGSPSFVAIIEDKNRCRLILPLIHGEWARRAAEREEAARQEALCAC